MQIEIHITSSALINNQLDDFSAFCQKIGAKPIIIELQGAQESQQPMISKTIVVRNRAVLDAEIKALKKAFVEAGYEVLRVKLEVDTDSVEAGRDLFPDYQGGYYEWHGQVNQANCEVIAQFGKLENVHISKNAMSGSAGARMLTIRSFLNKANLLSQIRELKGGLSQLGIEVLKEQQEYCVYDSNKSLDKGWLTTPEITDSSYLNLLAFEAFLRRASKLDLPFMLKGSLLSRQYLKNKNDRVIEDVDFLYFGEVKDDEQFMSEQLSRWAQAVTSVQLDDGVEYDQFNDNLFWRMMEYAMHEDFPTVNTDLSCTLENTRNSYVGLDISWGLPLNIKPVSLLYHPLKGEPFELKYTTPLSLQISWKLHQCVVRPRLKDLIDICDLLRDTKPPESVIREALQEFIAECRKDQIDANRLLAYVDGSLSKYLQELKWSLNKKKSLFGLVSEFFGIKKSLRCPIPNLGDFRERNLNFLRNVYPNINQRYQCMNDVLGDFEQVLKLYNITELLGESE